jgi:predicted ATPase
LAIPTSGRKISREPSSEPERKRHASHNRRVRLGISFAARRPSGIGGDGADLAAAVATIQEIGDADGFGETVADAFPGASVTIDAADGYFELEMPQKGLLRALKAPELSDGTLRYLLLTAALLSPRPPELMVLNEPKTSSHPDLLPPLARLIARASKRSQIIAVSHAQSLVAALRAEGARSIVLVKQLGETIVTDAEAPAWTWPAR